jgi:hypothetical protein
MEGRRSAEEENFFKTSKVGATGTDSEGLIPVSQRIRSMMTPVALSPA